jgi:hypothetical protein
MKEGVCKLCLQRKELCRESHIIPRFMYRFLTGENNSMVYVDTHRTRTKFNGEYEGGILCPACDNGIIGKLEDYAATFLYDSFRDPSAFHIENDHGQEYFVVENNPEYDYARFKLFLLSLLWRVSISSRPFFDKVKLPPDVGEDLRRMLLSQTPGEIYEYPCVIALPPLTVNPADGKRGFDLMYTGLTMIPYCDIKEGIPMCRLVIQGAHYVFVLNKISDPRVSLSVGKDKLVLDFMPIGEQLKLLKLVADTLKKQLHRDGKI